MEKSNQLKINLEEDNSRFLQNQEIEAEIRLNNGENYLSEARKNCDGVTMFDKPNSKDN